MKPLGPITALDLDEGRLREMLDLVGPGSEQRLLKSLVGDLETARAALSLALTADDGPAIRAQTHVLAALAGTFGAPTLAAAAKALDQRAKGTGDAVDRGAAGSEFEGSDVLAMTDRLTACLSDRLLPTPTARRAATGRAGRKP